MREKGEKVFKITNINVKIFISAEEKMLQQKVAEILQTKLN